MQGTLDAIGIGDLIETLRANASTGALRVRPGDEARVWFERGRLVHAEYRALRGEAVLEEILGWRTERFRFEPGRAAPERTITLGTETVLRRAVERLNGTRHTLVGGPPA
jgi:hypothetical protein